MTYASDLIPPYQPTDLTVPYRELRTLYERHPVKTEKDAYEPIVRVLKRVYKAMHRELSDDFTHNLYDLACMLLENNQYVAGELPPLERCGPFFLKETKRRLAPGRLDAALDQIFVLIMLFLDNAPETSNDADQQNVNEGLLPTRPRLRLPPRARC